MSPAAIGADLLEPLTRTLRWLASLEDSEGRLICPQHRIEHTGKSACAAILALELHGVLGEPWFLEFAVRQGRRLVANLVREGTSPCHTFRPGRHDPFNCSNSVIDGGAASDALASLVLARGESLDAADREAFAHASVLHAHTYLRYAVLDKGIPAQRAWGLTGLAAAAQVSGDRGVTQDLEKAAVEAVGVLEAVQHPDGSFPYHPIEWGAGHPGSSDVSSFYQSRVSGFTAHALLTLGRDPAGKLFRTPLERGLDFVRALQGVDGIKTGLVEAKPWYWGANYEVASHVFDVHALALGGRLFGRRDLGLAALAAWRSWVDHLGPDGVPTSHQPGRGRGPSYQCPLFWAAHACWIARVLPELEAAKGYAETKRSPNALDLSVTWFPGAQMGRLEDGRVVAWVRGGRPAFNAHHGGPHGAGLLRVQRRSDGAELLERCRFGGRQEAEWAGWKGAPSLARGLRSGGAEPRFSLWLARVAWRAGERGRALRLPLGVVRRAVLAPAAPRVASHFALAPRVEVLGDGFGISGPLAWRDGREVPGSRVERRLRVDGDGLEVEERLVGAGGARGLDYRVPAAALDVRRDGNSLRYRLA